MVVDPDTSSQGGRRNTTPSSRHGRRFAGRVAVDDSRSRRDRPAELTIEDLRPSQPEAPAGTADFAYGWGNAEPIISSVDGVEVDPIGEAPRPPQRPDDTDDSGR